MLIAPGQVTLGSGQILISGGPVPSDSLLPALLHTPAALIEESQAAGALRVSQLRPPAVPRRGGGLVHRRSLAPLAAKAHTQQSPGIFLLRRR